MTPAPGSSQTHLQRILDFENDTVDYAGVGKTEYVTEMLDYVSGKTLNTTDDVMTDKGIEKIHRYPLALNYYRQIVRTILGAVLGEWEGSNPKRVFELQFNPRGKPDQWGNRGMTETWKQVSRALENIWFGDIDGNVLVRDLGRASCSTGSSAVRLVYNDLSKRFEATVFPIQYVHIACDSYGKATEAAITQGISFAQAKAMGWQPSTDWLNQKMRTVSNLQNQGLTWWEYWNGYVQQIWIEDQCMFQTVNQSSYMDSAGNWMPGYIPIFTCCFNRDVDELYGHADIESSIQIGIEINLLMADISDSVNASNHPLRYIINGRVDGQKPGQSGGAVVSNGRDSLLSIRGDGAEFGQLEGKVLPKETADYVGVLIGMLQDTGYLPGPALGRVTGTQTSGIALQTELRPVVDVARDHRMDLGQCILEMSRFMVHMGVIKNLLNGAQRKIGGTVLAGMRLDDIVLLKPWMQVDWAPMLPRDEVTEVDKTCIMLEAGIIDPIEAMKRLGVRDPEEMLAKVQAHAQWKNDMAMKEKAAAAPSLKGPQRAVPDQEKKKHAAAQSTQARIGK